MELDHDSEFHTFGAIIQPTRSEIIFWTHYVLRVLELCERHQQVKLWSFPLIAQYEYSISFVTPGFSILCQNLATFSLCSVNCQRIFFRWFEAVAVNLLFFTSSFINWSFYRTGRINCFVFPVIFLVNCCQSVLKTFRLWK